MTFRVSDLIANVMPKEHDKPEGCTGQNSCPQCTALCQCSNVLTICCITASGCNSDSEDPGDHPCHHHTKREALAETLSLDLLRTALQQALAQG
jgi:hypothetical protein